MSEPHGKLSRVLVPPVGTMAVVDFERPDDAAQAFRAVAYRRLGNTVVYLAKGPLGIFAEGSAPAAPSTTGPSHAATKIFEKQIPGPTAGGEEEDQSIFGGTTLYLKNLAFSTTQERLNQLFCHLPSFSFVRIQTKPALAVD